MITKEEFEAAQKIVRDYNIQEHSLIDSLTNHLKLERPLAFFDLESTGLDTGKDRIVSIAVCKINPDGARESKYTLVNPTIPIPEKSTAVHGIRDEDVVKAPFFRQIAKSLYEFLKDCDLANYNGNFYDNPLLQEEFYRCGYDYPSIDRVNSVDVCAIFKHFEKRDLAAALKFYCGKDMVDAHNSEADTNATVDIFEGQLAMYPELRNMSVKEISDMLKTDTRIDWLGKILIDEEGEYRFNFGKAKDTKIKSNMGFGEWVLNNDFPTSFKALLREVMYEKLNK